MSQILPLESRRLLSAALDAGVLTITGTAKNDQIVVSLNSAGDTITVSEAAQGRFRRVTPTKTTFTAADVSSIVVNAGAGNDNVELRGTRKTVFSVNAILNGEAGNDNLRAAGGDDQLNGGEGDDNLFGGDGADVLNGDAGDDLLVGGGGIDTLNGGDGDDLLNSAGDDEVDILDGGADSDTTGSDDQDSALSDDDETATNATVVDYSDLLMGPGFGGHGFGGGIMGRPHAGFGGPKTLGGGL